MNSSDVDKRTRLILCRCGFVRKHSGNAADAAGAAAAAAAVAGAAGAADLMAFTLYKAAMSRVKNVVVDFGVFRWDLLDKWLICRIFFQYFLRIFT